jgi:hypothetical protein
MPRLGNSQKMTRKNLVDEHIFGRMERDGIPHSRLSTEHGRLRVILADEMDQFIRAHAPDESNLVHVLNVAVAREIPAMGSVIAYELEGQRKESDTFPTYMSMYMARCNNGAIGPGFLPTRTSGLDLDPTTVFDSLGGKTDGANAAIERRWRLLQEFEKVSGADRSALGKQAADYKTFYADARRIAAPDGPACL